MPELPEVETVKNHLNSLVKNEVISKVKVMWPNIIANINYQAFETKIKNQKIIDIKRKAKFLIFELSDFYLLSHLRMEGKYILKEDDFLGKHDHVVFYLESKKILIYNDVRKFGKIYLFEKDIDIYKVKPLSLLGLEANSSELSIEYLKTKFKRSTKPIKTVLLDQSIISGLGNIYANEVLFLSSINPYTKANLLDDIEIEKIIKYSKEILDKAILLGGTTIRTFKVHDINGRFQNSLNVHMKKNCPRCNSLIKKDFINTRSSYYCSDCQKIKE